MLNLEASATGRLTTDAVTNIETVGNETARIAALRRYGILDTAPDTAFDELTGLAASLCRAPIAYIGFIDEKRQWFKSRSGFDLREIPRDAALCNHAILQDRPLLVEDLREDARFRDNRLWRQQMGIRSYIAAPLFSPEGHALGTLAILDRKPARPDADQVQALEVLGRQVMAQLELRRHLGELARTLDEHKRTEDRLR